MVLGNLKLAGERKTENLVAYLSNAFIFVEAMALHSKNTSKSYLPSLGFVACVKSLFMENIQEREYPF